MDFWQRLSVKKKLFGMVSLGILALLIVSGINYLSVRKINLSLQDYEETFELSNQFDKVEDDIGHLKDTFTAIILGSLDLTRGAEEARKLVSQTQEDWKRFVKTAKKEDDSIALSDLKVFFRTLADKIEPAIAALEIGDLESFKEILRNELEPSFKDFEKHSENLAIFLTERSRRDYQGIISELSQSQRKILTVFVGALLILGILGALLAHQIEKGLSEVMEGLTQISRGKFLKAIPVVSRDELGRLATACNSLICGVGQILKTLKVQTEALTKASLNLSQVESVVNNNTQEIGHFAREVAAAAEQVTENLKTVSQAIEELSTATQEIAQNINETASIAQDAREKAEVATQVITGLKESSQKIGQIVQVINQIADQTNLLALNATIEAARAGEAGKGFAVVANEVKELAQQTSKATEEIAGMVGTIQQSVDEAVKAVHSVDEIIAKIGDLSTGIASATEEQTATTEDISRSVQEGISGVIQVNDQIKELAEKAGHIEKVSADLRLAEEAVADIVEEINTVNQSFVLDEKALETASEQAEESVQVLGMTFQHFQWREKLLIGILSKEKPEVHTDPSHCDLSKWLSGFRAPNSEIAEIIKRLDPEHQELHRSAEEVINLIEGKAPTKEVYQVLKEKISPRVKRVVSYLGELREKLEAA